MLALARQSRWQEKCGDGSVQCVHLLENQAMFYWQQSSKATKRDAVEDTPCNWVLISIRNRCLRNVWPTQSSQGLSPHQVKPFAWVMTSLLPTVLAFLAINHFSLFVSPTWLSSLGGKVAGIYWPFNTLKSKNFTEFLTIFQAPYLELHMYYHFDF